MATVTAASIAIRTASDTALVVSEPVIGPRFPNGVVLADADARGGWGRRGEHRLAVRRWWDPRCRVTQLRPDRVERFLAAVDPLALPHAPEDGIGWGPGLTPAGDDVVVGMLVGYRACGSPSRAAALAEACADTPTVPLSRSLLDHAAEGDAARPVLDLVAALAGRGSLAPAIIGLDRFGATSGRHILDGVRRAVAEAGTPR